MTGAEGPSALQQSPLLRGATDVALGRITGLAARGLGTAMAAVSIDDETCQWLFGRFGQLPPITPRAHSPCRAISDAGVPCAIEDLLSHPDHAPGLLANQGVRFHAGVPLVLPDGTRLGALCVMDAAPRGATAEALSMLSDYAVLVLNEIELRSAAGRIDPLSGLPNRSQCMEALATLARLAPDTPRLLALIDLAGADELSHMLQAVGASCLDDGIHQNAAALRRRFGAEMAIFHVATTQFALLAPPGMDADSLAARLRQELPHCNLGAAAFFATTCTAGLAAIVPGDAPPADQLRRAHAALDAARARRVPVGLFAPEQDVAFRRTFTLLHEFAAALPDERSLRLAFQPRLELASGRCIGVEALLRWNHPTLGDISPGEFVRIVEKTTMARAMMRWVLQTGVRQLVAWRAAGLVLRLSVNVSPANLEETDFARHVMEVVHCAGLPPGALELEVTENALLGDHGPAMQQLRALSGAGISIAIDDFGTGYSSLSYLQRLPADVVKIDQSFVKGLTPGGLDEGRRRTLVTAMIGLSHDLGYRVVAEGIETQAAADTLRHLGCDEGQGYLFARPMPAATFLAWHTQRPWRPAPRRAVRPRVAAARS